jgi:hypothetical protein
LSAASTSTDRASRTTDTAAALVTSSFSTREEHVHRGDLGPVGDVAGQDDHRAELAHRPGEGQGGAGQQGPGRWWEHDPPEAGQLAGAQAAGRLLHVRLHGQQHRLDRADTNGKVTNASAKTTPSRL